MKKQFVTLLGILAALVFGVAQGGCIGKDEPYNYHMLYRINLCGQVKDTSGQVKSGNAVAFKFAGDVKMNGMTVKSFSSDTDFELAGDTTLNSSGVACAQFIYTGDQGVFNFANNLYRSDDSKGTISLTSVAVSIDGGAYTEGTLEKYLFETWESEVNEKTQYAFYYATTDCDPKFQVSTGYYDGFEEVKVCAWPWTLTLRMNFVEGAPDPRWDPIEIPIKPWSE